MADVVTTLEKLRAAVEDRKPQATEGGVGSWLPKLMIAAIALIAAAIFAWKQWQQSKQLAALLHEKTVREVIQANTAVALANASDEEAIKKAAMDSNLSIQRLEETQKKLAAIEQQKVRDEKAIGSIRSWSDIAGG